MKRSLFTSTHISQKVAHSLYTLEYIPPGAIWQYIGIPIPLNQYNDCIFTFLMTRAFNQVPTGLA